MIVGDVPLGAGLSSSASLQAAVAWFLIQLGVVPDCPAPRFRSDRGDLRSHGAGQALRRSENEFVGVGSGLLDQFSSLFGRADYALFLDCGTLEFDRLPLGQPAPAIIVCDSKTSRRLADGMYDRRRAECERRRRGVPMNLDGGEPAALASEPGAARGQVAAPRSRRPQAGPARPDREERVGCGVEGLKSGDVEAFGALMSASHASSRDDFENSSEALDALIEAAKGPPASWAASSRVPAGPAARSTWSVANKPATSPGLWPAATKNRPE